MAYQTPFPPEKSPYGTAFPPEESLSRRLLRPHINPLEVEGARSSNGINDESLPSPPRADPPPADPSRFEIRRIVFDVEVLRMVGLASIIVMLIVGAVLTKTMTDINMEKTFIYDMFHFNHSCTYIDFNPAKTVAAVLIVFHIVPICLFLILNHYRVQAKTDPVFDWYKKANPFFSSITFIGTLWFYMVFVNSPDKPHGTVEAMDLFKMHYVPFMFWQLGMVTMHFEQCWYLILNGQFPFPCCTKTMFSTFNKIYFTFLLVYYVVYTLFVWSFLGWLGWLGFGDEDRLWETDETESPFGNKAALALMWGWNVLTIILPALLAYTSYKHKLGDCEIRFSEIACTPNVIYTNQVPRGPGVRTVSSSL